MIDPKEQQRRHALLVAHYAAENAHDLERIMATFASDAEMIYNGQRFAEPDHIRWAHGYIGMSSLAGAFTDVETIRDHEHCTVDGLDTETVPQTVHTTPGG